MLGLIRFVLIALAILMLIRLVRRLFLLGNQVDSGARTRNKVKTEKKPPPYKGEDIVDASFEDLE